MGQSLKVYFLHVTAIIMVKSYCNVSVKETSRSYCCRWL